MPCSLVQVAKRALVRLLITFATTYEISLNLSRDSPDQALRAAYKRVIVRVHPDKGGNVEHAKQLIEAKENWDKAVADSTKNQRKGRPAPRKGGESDGKASAVKNEGYRVRGRAVLLTYHGIKDLHHWRRFVQHVKDHLGSWSVQHWCGTLETTKAGKLHVHLMLEFRSQVNATVSRFAFESSAPRADTCDLLGEGFCRKKMRQSIDRAMFYCFADKIGTQRDEDGKECTVGNYFPAWVEDEPFTYTVSGRWPENLWKAYKLTTETYEQVYLYATRDGVVYRKRNLEACKEREETLAALAEKKEMAEVVKRIRTTCFDRPFPNVPEANAWLQLFQEEKDRYPFLLVVGPSHTGKTEWAKSLFRCPLEVKVGWLEHFPAKMREFSRDVHDGLVVDDIRDFLFLVKHQEKLQSKYDARIEFASTPGGQCSFTKWLWKVPTVVTANLTTKNPELLESDDFLGNPRNRVKVAFPPAEAA